jgi:Protein of unknown function (DUF3465)
MMSRKLVALAVFLLAALGWYYNRPQDLRSPLDGPSAVLQTAPAGDQAARAFKDEADGRQITVQGTVDRVLPDDRDGSRHQRFVVRTSGGQTLLVAHNIDLAQRLDGLRPGDTVILCGEYVWNNHGGLMHWTHHDPGGRHAAGYIEWQGRRYQ